MSLSNFDPYFAFGGKIDPLSEIRNAGIVTNGSVLWVKAVADTDYTTFQDQVGASVVTNTVQAAIDKCRDDRNDYVMVVPQNANAVFSQGTALDMNKDRVHLIGIGYNKAKSSYSVTLKSSMGTVPDSEVVAVTGDGCEIAGLRILGTLGTNDGGTMTNGDLYVAGHDLWVHDSVIEDSSAAWGTPPLVRGGGTLAHDARFDDCRFFLSGTNVESAGNAPMVLGGAGNKRWQFNDCVFKMTAGSVTETFFTPGTGVKEVTNFNRCHFGMVNGTSYAITSAIRGTTTANNPILLSYCTSLAVTALGTDPNVFSMPNQAGTAGAGIHNLGAYLVGTAAVVAA